MLGVLGTFVYYAGDMVCLWAALRLVDAHIPMAALVLAYTAGYLLTRRALPAGGAGFVEIALTFALLGTGIGLARALLGDLRRRFQRAEQTA